MPPGAAVKQMGLAQRLLALSQTLAALRAAPTVQVATAHQDRGAERRTETFPGRAPFSAGTGAKGALCLRATRLPVATSLPLFAAPVSGGPRDERTAALGGG
jgi:hypothetical protein